MVMVPASDQLPVRQSYSSAVAMSYALPPATSTFPFCKSVAVWPLRGVIMGIVAVHVPVAGLYNCAFVVPPPATSTCPLGNNVADPLPPFAIIVPVIDHVPVAGSYSSADVPVLSPPATSTWPSDS